MPPRLVGTPRFSLPTEPASADVVGTQRPVIAVTYRSAGAKPDAILAYSENLAAALSGTDRAVGTLVAATPGTQWTRDGRVKAPDLVHAVDPAGWLLLQYNPFSYGHWGIAPWLLKDLGRVRRGGTSVAVMVHEAFVSPTNSRQWLLRTWQRAQLKAVLDRADIAFAATASLVDCVCELRPELPVHHAPVGSNFPDGRAARAPTRARLELEDGDI